MSNILLHGNMIESTYLLKSKMEVLVETCLHDQLVLCRQTPLVNKVITLFLFFYLLVKTTYYNNKINKSIFNFTV